MNPDLKNFINTSFNYDCIQNIRKRVDNIYKRPNLPILIYNKAKTLIADLTSCLEFIILGYNKTSNYNEHLERIKWCFQIYSIAFQFVIQHEYNHIKDVKKFLN